MKQLTGVSEKWVCDRESAFYVLPLIPSLSQHPHNDAQLFWEESHVDYLDSEAGHEQQLIMSQMLSPPFNKHVFCLMAFRDRGSLFYGSRQVLLFSPSFSRSNDPHSFKRQTEPGSTDEPEVVCCFRTDRRHRSSLQAKQSNHLFPLSDPFLLLLCMTGPSLVVVFSILC